MPSSTNVTTASPAEGDTPTETTTTGATEAPLPTPTYYAGKSLAIISQIEKYRDETLQAHERKSKAMLACGSRLRWIKLNLPHGQFGPWLAAEMPQISDRTARFYMQAHEYAEANPNRKALADLPATIIGLLAAPSTPESAREEILERVDDGETVTDREARKIITDHKPAKAANENAAAGDQAETDDDAECRRKDELLSEFKVDEKFEDEVAADLEREEEIEKAKKAAYESQGGGSSAAESKASKSLSASKSSKASKSSSKSSKATPAPATVETWATNGLAEFGEAECRALAAAIAAAKKKSA